MIKRFLNIILLLLVGHGLSAQTPVALNENSNLSYDKALDEYTFSWDYDGSATYFVQTSDDLINWTYLNVIKFDEPNNESWIKFTTNSDKTFWRLVKEDRISFDPEMDDFDGDGLPNKFELDHGLNPAHEDSEGDLDGDGISNAVEYLNGSDPSVAGSGPGGASAAVVVHTELE